MKIENGFTGLKFNVRVAKALGVEEAIMLHFLSFWCFQNEERKSLQHFHEGTYWIYYSRRKLAEKFVFWSEDKIRRILDKLVSRGHLRKGRFNRKGYDKTSWYTPVHRYTRLEVANPEE